MHPPGSANDVRYFEPAPPRELYRPRISAVSAITAALWLLVIPITAGCGAYLVCTYSHTEHVALISALVAVAALTVAAALRLKDFIIWCVLVYQHYARDDVRLRCLYTPSCSDYMIMSVIKYGAVRGVIRGIKRLKRCHYPNGGRDYP